MLDLNIKNATKVRYRFCTVDNRSYVNVNVHVVYTGTYQVEIIKKNEKLTINTTLKYVSGQVYHMFPMQCCRFA